MKRTGTASIVVDASVAIKWFLSEIHNDEAHLILESKWELWAPDLIWVEFVSILTKKIRLKEMTIQEAEGILKDFMRFPIQTNGLKLLLNSAWQLSIGLRTTIYDNLYLALAISRECHLITADKKFYQSIMSSKEITHSRIVWIEDVGKLIETID